MPEIRTCVDKGDLGSLEGGRQGAGEDFNDTAGMKSELRKENRKRKKKRPKGFRCSDLVTRPFPTLILIAIKVNMSVRCMELEVKPPAKMQLP